MLSFSFVIELKRTVPEANWPWLFPALLQENTIWESLQGEFGKQALLHLGDIPAAYSPAALCLLALGYPEPVKMLRAETTDAISGPIIRSDVNLRPESPPLLAAAGTQALTWLEQIGASNGWQDIYTDRGAASGEVSSLAVSCLYGMVPEPLEFLADLLRIRRPDLAVHALLCTPAPISDQSELLAQLTSRVPIQESLSLLRLLGNKRSILAVSMAQSLLQADMLGSKGIDLGACLNGAGLHGFYDQLNALLLQAEVLRLAAQPKQAIPVLTESIRVARRVQSQLAFRLALACAEDMDRQNCLAAWEQASRLDPESLDHLSGMLIALLDDNRQPEALAQLNEHPHQTGTLLHQPAALRYARARLALNAGEVDTARHQAEHALNIMLQPSIEGNQEAHSYPKLALNLARLFMEISSPRSAIRSIRVALGINPSDIDAIALLSNAQLAAGRIPAAIDTAHLAVSLAPDRHDLRRELARKLEAAGEWLDAYSERSILVSRQIQPTKQDMVDLAACALAAGKPDRAIEISQQLLGSNENDGIAIAMLGEALAFQGKVQEALDHLNRATQLIPDQPSPWLALARVLQAEGEQGRAMDTLRAATLASPDQPEILLALGEASLKENSPSAALTPLRKAYSLVSEDRPPAASTLTNRIALRLGQTLSKLGHMQEARQSLETAYLASPYHPEIALSYAQVLLVLDDPAPALAPLQTVVSSELADPAAYLDFARCVLSLDGCVQPEYYKMALHYLGKAMEIDPDLPEARAYSAEVMAASGDLQPALTAYRRALETRLSYDPSWRMRLWLGLGKVALDLDQIETAVAALQEASQAAPLSPDVHHFLCEAYDAAGLVDNAFESAQTALNLASDDFETLLWFAKKANALETKAGILLPDAHQQASQALEQAARIVSDRGDLLVRLGQAQQLIGEGNSAQHTFHRLVGHQDGDIPGFAIEATPVDLRQAAAGLLTLGDPTGAISCLERALQIFETNVPKQVITDDTHIQLQIALLVELIAAYQQVGQRLPALQAVEQAINIDPKNVDYYIKKAELSLQLEPGEAYEQIRQSGRADLALIALETALEIQPDHPDLLMHASLVCRLIGNITGAYEYARKAVQCWSSSTGTGAERRYSPLTANILAADLARSLLQVEQAAAWLESPPDGLPEASHLDWLEYYCLRAELALDYGNAGLATQQIALAVELAPDHPSLLALQARLSVRKGELPISGFANGASYPAIDIFKLAISAFNEQRTCQETGTDQTIWRSVDACSAARRRLAQAALDLRLWDAAVQLAEESVQSSPAEPHGQLCMARTLVLRAECQLACQSMDITSHAPGEDALSEDSFRSFLFAIQNAEVAAVDQGERRPSARRAHVENSNADPDYMIQRWQARGMAVFAPNAQAAETLTQLPRNPDDTLAEIACLSRIGDLITAGKAASTFSRNPFVLAQLAMGLSSAKPRQALAAAFAAVEALEYPEDPSREQIVPGEIVLRRHDIPLAYALLARLTHQQGNPLEDATIAIQAIQKALKYWPDEPRWHTLAAEIYLSQSPEAEASAVESAISHLEQAIHFAPNDPTPAILLGEIFAGRGESEKAIRLLKRAAELEPQDTRIWMLLASAYQNAGNIPEAAASAEKSVALAPGQVSPLLLRGKIALAEGNPKGAQTSAEAAIRIDPESREALHLMARSLRDLDQPEGAILLLEKVLSGDTFAPLPLHIEYLQLVRQARGPSAALQVAMELGEKYPDEPLVLSELAKTLAEDGQMDQAIQVTQHALRAKGSCDQLSPKEAALLHYQLGTLLSQAGQLDQAIHHLVQAIQSYPDFIEPYLELGRVHQGRRQHSQAIATFNKAIAASPNDARPYYHAGMALKENKDYVEAEKMLRRACELDPENVSVHRLLGAVVTLNMVHNRREQALVG